VRTLSWRVKIVVAAVARVKPTSQSGSWRKSRVGDQRSLVVATTAPKRRESPAVSA
jgi:hypothetical protein